ncbi:hypothetical protein J4212_02585 [Candidatus Woesearchaeota archaeon]|nr:hypothetical protein [Candidatus Woesearchaeota archaeon]
MINNIEGKIASIEAEFRSYVRDIGPEMQHDLLAFDVIEEAIEAAKRGNFGVSAIIVDVDGNRIVKAQNTSVYPRVDTGGHAERTHLMSLRESTPRGIKSH